MKTVGALSTLIVLVVGLQLTLAQDAGVTSCAAIAAGLGTAEIAPATGIYSDY